MQCRASRRLRCTTSFAALLFSDKAKEPGVPQAFFCPKVKKNPVVGAKGWIVGIVFHQVASKASIDCEAPMGSCSGGAADSVTSVTRFVLDSTFAIFFIPLGPQGRPCVSGWCGFHARAK